MIRALPAVDRLHRDGRTLILLQHQVLELGPLALTAYDAASGGVTHTDLVELLVADFGTPPDRPASEAVASVIDELVALGLLVRDTPQAEPTEGNTS